MGGEAPALQGHHATNADHLARTCHPRWQDEDLVITATPEGRTVQRQPLLVPMENMPRPYSFGMVGADPICWDTLHHLFADHTKCSYVNDLYQIDLPKADQPTPMVNMEQIRQLSDETLHTILEESLEPYFEGSTSSCPPFSLGFGRELFMVSHDSVAVDGETSVQRHEHKARNTDRQ